MDCFATLEHGYEFRNLARPRLGFLTLPIRYRMRSDFDCSRLQRMRTPSGGPQAEIHAGTLFNHGSRARNQPVGDLNSQLLGRFEIDDKFKPICLRVRYVARIGSP